jgi:hypothetical protein
MIKNSKTLLLQTVAAAGGVLCALAAIGILNSAAFPFSRPKPPAGFVMERYGPTTVYAPTATAAREGREDVQYARARFHALFSTDAPALAVVLVEEPAHLQLLNLARLRPRGGRVLPFLTRAGLSSSTGSATIAKPEQGDGDGKLLAHEACHGYVAALADGVAWRVPVRGGYGHGALPDWFDESIATLCESEERRAARRRYFRDHLNQRIPLTVFTQMPHPLSGAEVLEKLGIHDTPGHASVQILTAERIREALPDSDPMLFYAQALSLGEFIEERIGEGEMHLLARSLANSPDFGRALEEVHRAVPGIPATVNALEAEWLRWVTQDASN